MSPTKTIPSLRTTGSDRYEQVLAHFTGVKPTAPGKCVAICSGHPDRTPSLYIAQGESGRILLHCHAGCSTESVLQAAGLSWSDLFSEKLTPEVASRYRRERLESSRHHAGIVLNIYEGMRSRGEETSEADDVLAARCLQDLEQINAELETLGPLPAPLLPEVDISGVMAAEPEPVRFVVEQWLPRGYVTLLGGHGAIGKSMFALALGAHVAAGAPYAQRRVERGRVVYASFEDGPLPVLLRVRRIIEGHSLAPALVLENLCVLDGTQGPSALITSGDGFDSPPLFTAALQRLEEAAHGAALVIIDNASDAFDCNENARREVRAFMRRLYQLAQANDCAVLLLHHIDKAAARGGAQGNNYSGSTAWHNSARSRLALVNESREGGPEQIVLRHEKASHSAPAEPVCVERDPSGVLLPQLPQSFAERALIDEDFDQAQIIRAMRAAAESGINVRSSVEPGLYSAMKSLEVLPEYESAFNGRAGGRRAARAITALIRSGKLRVETFAGPHRKIRERLVLSESAPNPNSTERKLTADRRQTTPKNTPEKVRCTPPHTPPMSTAHSGGGAPNSETYYGAPSAQNVEFGAVASSNNPNDFRSSPEDQHQKP